MQNCRLIIMCDVLVILSCVYRENLNDDCGNFEQATTEEIIECKKGKE